MQILVNRFIRLPSILIFILFFNSNGLTQAQEFSLGYAIHTFSQPKASSQLDSNYHDSLNLSFLLESDVPYDSLFFPTKGILMNYHKESEYIMVEDRRLVMVLEAKVDNNWIPIKYHLPASCGNSYRGIELEHGYSMEFSIPDYSGSSIIQIRLKLCTGRELIYSEPLCIVLKKPYSSKIALQ
ncbi:MAG: hypothetical protein AAF806_08760 [Bacteroidota bacterium]